MTCVLPRPYTVRQTFNPISTGLFGWCSTGGVFSTRSLTPLSLKIDDLNFVKSYSGIR